MINIVLNTIILIILLLIFCCGLISKNQSKTKYKIIIYISFLVLIIGNIFGIWWYNFGLQIIVYLLVVLIFVLIFIVYLIFFHKKIMNCSNCGNKYYTTELKGFICLICKNNDF